MLTNSLPMEKSLVRLLMANPNHVLEFVSFTFNRRIFSGSVTLLTPSPPSKTWRSCYRKNKEVQLKTQNFFKNSELQSLSGGWAIMRAWAIMSSRRYQSLSDKKGLCFRKGTLIKLQCKELDLRSLCTSELSLSYAYVTEHFCSHVARNWLVRGLKNTRGGGGGIGQFSKVNMHGRCLFDTRE